MAKTKRRSREEWAGLVAKWRSSGMSGVEFARRHRLGYGSLYRWGRLLGDEAEAEVHDPGAAEPVTFAEVRIREAAPQPEASVEVVAPGGWVVRLRGKVDVEQLRAVLEVIESC